jgi:hypothetical protein
MINTDKINQLGSIMPSNCRLPSKQIIHLLAHNENAIQSLLSSPDVHNHIAFLVIKPEESNLLRKEIFRSVHCVIIKGYGVILSSNCSLITEGILEYIAKWVPFLKVKEDVQYYGNNVGAGFGP